MRLTASCLLLLLLGCASPGGRPTSVSPDRDATAPRVLRSGLAEVNGVRLWYEVRGEGPPVVLLHGGLHSVADTFPALGPMLARHYQTIAIEQVGHGHSPDSDRPTTYQQMADDTAAVMAHLGIARADLVGWSDGGTLALLVAIRHPERVRRVVASGANLRRDGNVPEVVDWTRKFTLSEPWIAEREKAWEKTTPDRPDRWATIVEKVRERWLTEVIIEREQLGSIKQPALILSGDNDTTALEHSVEMFKSLPRGQLCVLPRTGHATYARRPEWLLPILREFLDAPEKP